MHTYIYMCALCYRRNFDSQVILKFKISPLILLIDILSASVGAGKVAVRVQIKRLGADVDNNHTNILCAVTAY